MKTSENRSFASPMLTDGGLETTLIYHHGIDLPHFAAFDLLKQSKYWTTMAGYYRQYLDLAKQHGTGFILESATWRANPDWGYKLGYSDQELREINELAIRQLQKLKREYSPWVEPLLISGCLGPRSDGYQVRQKMTAAESRRYHDLQISTFKLAGADLVSGMTLNYIGEALGMVQAAQAQDIPIVISFTVETDGSLPSGEQLREALTSIDQHTDAYPLYYMINCAHPSHFAQQLEAGESWTQRIAGIRANASHKSHAELDQAQELDPGDKEELANWYHTLSQQLPNLIVYGGCCGTDITHIEAICNKVLAVKSAS